MPRRTLTNDEDLYYYIDATFLAEDAFGGRTRWFTDEPYVNHGYRVANHVALLGGDVDMQVAALLHDVIEDTHHTRESLLSHHIRPHAIDLIEVLTHRDDESYGDYIERVKANPEATTIKLADLSDNLATLPVGHPLSERYVAALHVLHDV